MPAQVENLVKKLLDNPDFYPDKSAEDRKSIAWAIAQTQNKEGNLHANHEPLTMEFFQLNTPTEIRIEASGQGDILVFKNAILARAETNKNNDEILPEGISELAATIGGRPLDVEHDHSKNCGVFTAGREIVSDGVPALAVDGLVWADRYPEIASGIQAGTHGLSVDAVADKAKCSMCAAEFDNSVEYCEHIKARRNLGSKRIMMGLKGKGGAATKKPAGTNTTFDSSQIAFVASHEENELEASWYDGLLPKGETIDDLPASDFADSKNRKFPYKIHGKVIKAGWVAAWSAAHGGHTGVKSDAAIAKLKRDKPADVDIQESEDVPMGDKLEAEVIPAPLADTTGTANQPLGKDAASVTAAKPDAETPAEDKKETPEDEKKEGDKPSSTQASIEAQLKETQDKLAASMKASEDLKKELDSAKECITAAEKKVADMTAMVRRNALTAMSDEQWEKDKEAILGMDDKAFKLIASAYAGGKTRPFMLAGIGMPEPVAGSTSKKAPLSLK